jgi:PII-like signaling protein
MDGGEQQAWLLRVYVGESTHAGHRPAWEEIMLRAHAAGMAGVTVYRGIAGYGRTSHIHTTKILRLSSDLPMVVEIVDTEERIASFRETVEQLVPDGMAISYPVTVWFYRGREPED